MEITEWLKRTFYLICGLVAAGMSTYWLNEYWLDKDISTINYKQAKEVEIESRPVMSLCFNLENMVKIEGSKDKGNLYLDFMRGRFWDTNSYIATLNERNLNTQNATYNRTMWTTIDYHSVSLELADFIKEYELIWQNGTSSIHDNFDFNLLRYPESSYSGTILYTADFIKCFQILLGNDEISNVKLTIKKEIFPPITFVGGLEVRAQIRPQSRGLFVVLHRAGQILLSRRTLIHNWKEFAQYVNSFDTWITVENIEVLKRRHKKTKPCFEGVDKYDATAIKDHVMSVGCRAPFQMVNSEIPICSTSKDMHLAQYSVSLENFDSNPYPRPCNSMENIKFSYEDNGVHEWGPGFVRLWPLKPSYYFKEIEQTKAIPFLDLVGNVGGFIGIFIGHSVLQLLQFILSCGNKINQTFFRPYWKIQ